MLLFRGSISPVVSDILDKGAFTVSRKASHVLASFGFSLPRTASALQAFPGHVPRMRLLELLLFQSFAQLANVRAHSG